MSFKNKEQAIDYIKNTNFQKQEKEDGEEEAEELGLEEAKEIIQETSFKLEIDLGAPPKEGETTFIYEALLKEGPGQRLYYRVMEAANKLKQKIQEIKTKIKEKTKKEEIWKDYQENRYLYFSREEYWKFIEKILDLEELLQFSATKAEGYIELNRTFNVSDWRKAKRKNTQLLETIQGDKAAGYGEEKNKYPIKEKPLTEKVNELSEPVSHIVGYLKGIAEILRDSKDLDQISREIEGYTTIKSRETPRYLDRHYMMTQHHREDLKDLLLEQET
ncbi:MAG: hypothetical protein BTN85_2031 [Candidatus Methanohalarchaeum thermophilum]|uniref:Uncharacterized protein n=1 Tax=Methanohalarchaeum thermophilum TaxID=1903181 RepID=A0A1Q6DSR9_METT1|nr:MAG: hypothetical protein BTN85_2031 [Candidatus Methanohalarchaeum thermophilum]